MFSHLKILSILSVGMMSQLASANEYNIRVPVKLEVLEEISYQKMTLNNHIEKKLTKYPTRVLRLRQSTSEWDQYFLNGFYVNTRLRAVTNSEKATLEMLYYDPAQPKKKIAHVKIDGYLEKDSQGKFNKFISYRSEFNAPKNKLSLKVGFESPVTQNHSMSLAKNY